MPISSRQAKRSRTGYRGRNAKVPIAPAPARPAPAKAARTEVPAGNEQDVPVNGRRRPVAARSGPARPTRPPRPQAPGLAAVRRKAGLRQVATAAIVPGKDNGRYASKNPPAGAPVGSTHPLTDAETNARLTAYDAKVKYAFDRIVPELKQIASYRVKPDFIDQAKRIAERELGVELPDHLLEDAWTTGLDMRRLFAWVLFETYKRIGDEFFDQDPLGGREDPAFQQFLLDCGFHLMDVTPCADGRLGHAISYVLRLPYGMVRRKSYAGALFDIENTVEKWVETELRRFREGVPNTSDESTRYLKVVVYHFSSVDPGHQGCAAHGSDDAAAAREGWERLQGFREAIENGFCCGASVDLLLMGVDTDTDAIRVHVPDGDGGCDLNHWLDAREAFDATARMTREQAQSHLMDLVRAHEPGGAGRVSDGMTRLIVRLIENNFSQLDLVRQVHGGRYQDVGHAERFIGAGVGFEEIQLRNLTYFAYLQTVEEGAADLDVGIKIFTGLNLNHGLPVPVPVVLRYDYHGGVPGARDRAVGHVDRLAAALADRYEGLHTQGMLHVLRVVRDCDAAGPLEVVGSTVAPPLEAGH